MTLNKAIDYLYLRDVGFLELMFALTPMLSSFSLGSMPLSLLMWVVLVVIVALKGKLDRTKVFKPLLFFILYWFVHGIAIMLVDDVNLNGFIAQLIYFVSVFLLYPVLDLKKLKGSLNWVAVVSIMGLIYQWIDIQRGGMIHPLGIPGLTMPENRLLTESLRPSSFYMEPAAYVAFMICPLFIALFEKKYIWGVTIILSIFLTTSTTGLVLSFVILGMSVLSARKMKVWTWVVTLLIGGGLYYALINFDAFELGVQKVENTDTSTNVRLTQGVYVVGTMQPSEYIFGVPYSSAYNYCKSGRAMNVEFYGKSVFVPTFWEILLLYGLVGIILYMYIYYYLFKRDRTSRSLIIALCMVLFSSSYAIGVYYIFTLIIILAMYRNNTEFAKKHLKINNVR